jgi:hypothetical protein
LFLQRGELVKRRIQNAIRQAFFAATVWGGVIGVLCSCAPEVNVRGVHNLNKKYGEELQRWTRGERIYYSLDRIMFVYATYLSPEFRKVFNDQYITFFGMNPEKVDTDLEKVAASTGQGHEFFLYADTPELGWNNLDNRDSVWRVGLWGGSQQPGAEPILIRPFKDRGPNVRAFFPFISDFGRAYLVVFPLEQQNGAPVLEGDGELSVKLSSALGTAIMSWKISK